jgi:hypothetical protein
MAQNLIRGTLAARDPGTCLTLRVPELRAAAWLEREHGGPALDEAPGVIGELWRQRDLGPSARPG